jgi:hypothetical protein
LSPKLALADTCLAPGTAIPIDLTDILRPEEAGRPTHLNISLISATVPVTVTQTHHIRCDTCPNTVHQPFLIVFPEYLLGLILFENF